MKKLLTDLTKGKFDNNIKNFLISEIEKVAVSSELVELLKNKIGDDYAEEILAELTFKIYIMFRKGNLEKKDFINKSYLRRMIQSCIVDVLEKDKKISVINLESFNYKDEEGRIISFEEKFGTEIDNSLSIDVEYIFNTICETLTEKDYDVLCYYLYKEYLSKEIILDNMTKNNLYKRWERLKRKIVNKLDYVPSHEEFKEFAYRFMSDVCEKRGYLFKEEKNEE